MHESIDKRTLRHKGERVQMAIRVRPSHRNLLKRKAKASGKDFNEWALEVLLREARA